MVMGVVCAWVSGDVTGEPDVKVNARNVTKISTCAITTTDTHSSDINQSIQSLCKCSESSDHNDNKQ